jgi:nucleotide-binding universal stress UspA family protein
MSGRRLAATVAIRPLHYRRHTMLHDLFLPITQTGGDDNALAAAVALASAHGAHLSVVQPVNLPLPTPGPWGMTPEFVMDQMYAQLREEATRQAERLRTRLAREDISWEVRLGEAVFDDPPRAMARQARHADLSVMAAPIQGAEDAPVARAWLSAMLFESGRPVLLVPAHHRIELPIRHAVVAWKPTRESTRALHDALPLLTQASSVDVAVVEPAARATKPDELAGVDIATHLARHDLKVNVVRLPRNGDTVATCLLTHAARSDAQLLVAGGYGHSRLREWVLGGTTRELLQAIHLPILFAH